MRASLAPVRAVTLGVLVALALAGCGGDSARDRGDSTLGSGDSEPDSFVVGAVDDAVRHPGPTLKQLREAGFEAVGATSYWQPGLTEPTSDELAALRDVAARADGL